MKLKPLFEDGHLLPSIDEHQTQLKVFHDHFVEDFIKNPFTVDNKTIKIIEKKSVIPVLSAYSETFAHIITRKNIVTKERYFEPVRANRIHWIRPILLAHPCKDILYYKWKDEDKICKEHFWYFSKDFMVVLKNISADLQIVTAFCTDKDDQLKFFERYRNFSEGNGNC